MAETTSNKWWADKPARAFRVFRWAERGISYDNRAAFEQDNPGFTVFRHATARIIGRSEMAGWLAGTGAIRDMAASRFIDDVMLPTPPNHNVRVPMGIQSVQLVPKSAAKSEILAILDDPRDILAEQRSFYQERFTAATGIEVPPEDSPFVPDTILGKVIMRSVTDNPDYTLTQIPPLFKNGFSIGVVGASPSFYKTLHKRALTKSNQP